MITHLNPSKGVYTGVCPGDGSAPPVFGQVRYTLGERSARVTFLTPLERLERGDLPDLLEHLTTQAGKWGAVHLVAEIDEKSPVFEGLRRAGFSVFAWERIWKIADGVTEAKAVISSGDGPAADSTAVMKKNGRPGAHSDPEWKTVRSSDRIAVQNLYQSLIPALVQPVEPLPDRRLTGMVYRIGSDLLSFVDPVYGPNGIWMQPFIHPATEHVPDLLDALVHRLGNRRGRPVYVCVRSYQAWLEPALEQLGANLSPRQAVLVKHMAITQRASQTFAVPTFDHAQPERPASVARMEGNCNPPASGNQNGV